MFFIFRQFNHSLLLIITISFLVIGFSVEAAKLEKSCLTSILKSIQTFYLLDSQSVK